jgi:hypothetical protein
MKKKATSTHKKVLVETRSGEKQQGYVKFPKFAKEKGMELLDPAGQIIEIPWKSLKIVWFVKDWEENAPSLQTTTFNRRPRMEGLWLRLRFRDDTLLDGVLVNDLLHLDPYGFLISPPAFNGNTQTVFVPRAALRSAEILSVVGGPAPQTKRRRAPAPGQTQLFDSGPQ